MVVNCDTREQEIWYVAAIMAEIETENDFTVWDYVVFVAVLVISASIGVVYGCIKSRQKSTEEFLMANREMTVSSIYLRTMS